MRKAEGEVDFYSVSIKRLAGPGEQLHPLWTGTTPDSGM